MSQKFLSYLVICLSLFSLSQKLAAQERWTVSGRVTDQKSGEILAGVFVRVVAEPTTIYTYSDKNGWYTLSLPAGNTELEFFYHDFKIERITVRYDYQNRRVNVAMEPWTLLVPDVLVLAEKEDFRIRRPDMGIERINSQTIKKIPTLLGEVDVIKALQLLPGVMPTSEGSTGFIVRGGSYDQNLVLFDHAAVYNPSHMMGFFSIFNNDAVANVQLYKGDIPAGYGGRLSSLLEVEGREGTQDFNVNGGIGLIASRLSASGPLGKKITWLAAARRTYADIFLPLLKDTMVKKAIIHFYDLNGKLRWRINESNYLTFTVYNGNDRFGASDVGFNFGNSLGALVWNHRFSPRLSLATSATGTMYQYDFKANMSSIDAKWIANIKEAGLRTDFYYIWNERTSMRFGWSGMYQWFRPGNISVVLDIYNREVDRSKEMSPKQALLNTIYFSNEHKLFDKRLHLRYGLRFTRFDNVGPTKQHYIDENYKVTKTVWVPTGSFYHHEYGVEPRLALSFMLNEQQSIKASYSRTLQYVHLLSFSTSGSPLDVWIPSNPSIKPQKSHQYAVGFFSGFRNNKIQASVELFYKDMNHVMDFMDHPNLLLYDTVETQLRFGKGYAYGAELMLKKETGDLSGWISYTWLRSFRKIDGVNDNKRYPAPSDRPHSISVTLNYQFPFYRRLETSVNWIYTTGQPYVMPEGRYYFFGEFIPVYSSRNAYRMPDYHRMDVSLILNIGRLQSRFKNELNLSVYNVYGRKNPWMINYRLSRHGAQYSEMTYLFNVVPSITWNFSF